MKDALYLVTVRCRMNPKFSSKVNGKQFIVGSQLWSPLAIMFLIAPFTISSTRRHVTNNADLEEIFTDTRRKFGKALPKLSAEFNMQN